MTVRQERRRNAPVFGPEHAEWVERILEILDRTMKTKA